MKKTYYFDYFANIDKAEGIKSPTFIFHGEDDDVVPFEDGKSFSRMLKEGILYEFLPIQKGGHNNLFKLKKLFIFEKIQGFLISLMRNTISKDEEVKSNKNKTNINRFNSFFSIEGKENILINEEIIIKHRSGSSKDANYDINKKYEL